MVFLLPKQEEDSHWKEESKYTKLAQIVYYLAETIMQRRMVKAWNACMGIDNSCRHFFVKIAYLQS
jgi:hypothetical protein